MKARRLILNQETQNTDGATQNPDEVKQSIQLYLISNYYWKKDE